ncbi:hypothetical protein B0H10DRAFT_2209583 [Mycena sp. CBHHK59/15]|nr:hypothetical protein B0H10DRAFT_2209583 [Mycena sp. CBHHK59/15]
MLRRWAAIILPACMLLGLHQNPPKPQPLARIVACSRRRRICLRTFFQSSYTILPVPAAGPPTLASHPSAPTAPPRLPYLSSWPLLAHSPHLARDPLPDIMLDHGASSLPLLLSCHICSVTQVLRSITVSVTRPLPAHHNGVAHSTQRPHMRSAFALLSLAPSPSSPWHPRPLRHSHLAHAPCYAPSSESLHSRCLPVPLL